MLSNFNQRQFSCTAFKPEAWLLGVWCCEPTNHNPDLAESQGVESFEISHSLVESNYNQALKPLDVSTK